MWKMGWFGVVMVHSRSVGGGIALFDRAHEFLFLSHFVVTMSLSCTVSEI